MSYKAIVYQVFIASPGDTEEERDIARRVLIQWNATHAEYEKMVLLPVGWETNGAPEVGRDPQEYINCELLDKCDILIGIFKNSVGTLGKAGIGRTEEEILRHINNGRIAMIYFSNQSLPSDVNTKQVEQVRELKNKFQNNNAYTGEYSNLQELESKLYCNIEKKLNESRFIFKQEEDDFELSKSEEHRFSTLEEQSQKMKVEDISCEEVVANYEKLFDNNSNDKKNAVTIAVELRRLSLEYTEEHLEQAISVLEKIYYSFSSDKQITICMAESLVNLSTKQNRQNLQMTVGRVDELYHLHTDIPELAGIYSKCLVNCTARDRILAEQKIRKLEELSQTHPEDIEVAISLGCGLANMCQMQGERESVDIVTRMKNLYGQFRNEPEIVGKYAKVLRIVADKQQVRNAVDTVNCLGKLHTENPDIEDVAIWYAKSLVDLCARQSGKDMFETFKCMENLYAQYSNVDEIVVSYAMCLCNWQRKQNVEEAKTLAERMERLYIGYPHIPELAEGMMRCLINLCAKQENEEEMSITTSRMNVLYSRHHNVDMAYGYAICLYNLSIVQHGDNLLRTVDALENLYKSYPGSRKIAIEYASILGILSNRQNKQELMNTVKRIEEVYAHYQDVQEILMEYTNVIRKISVHGKE